MSNKALPQIDNVYSGVDWISATLGREEIDSEVWLNDCLKVLSMIQREGNAYRARKLLGFDGWECGGSFVGSNETMHYAQFAGHHADMAYMFCNHAKVHISRVDLQVTIQYSEELQKEGRLLYAHAVRHNKGLPEYRRRKINLFAGSDGADTVYIGAPSSGTRARIYNKQLQSGDIRYDRAWRYEVVYRNEYALPVFRHIVNTPNPATAIIIPEVVSYFITRGVAVRGLGDWRGNAIPLPKAAPTDVERKLKWLAAQVVPTIRKLCELGYAIEVGDLLANALVPPDGHTQEGGTRIG